MKTLRSLLITAACCNLLIGETLASPPSSKLANLPSAVKSLVPNEMTPIFYQSDEKSGNAVVVLESQPLQQRSSNSEALKRLLILFRKEGVSYKEIDRSDKIMACSKCGDGGADPFIKEGIKLNGNNLTIEQDYSAEPSIALYKFTFNDKIKHWVVVSAINFSSEQNAAGSKSIKKTNHLIIPKPPLIGNFNPNWKEKELTIAIVANEKLASFSFLHGNSKDDIEKKVEHSCSGNSSCHELTRQTSGCVALTKSGEGKFFTGTSSKSGQLGKNEAMGKALDSCKLNGNGACEDIRSDCI